MASQEQLELRRKWVAALRSGQYEQGYGKLKVVPTNGNPPRYCCLGLLCEVAGLKSERASQASNVHFFDGVDTILPSSVMVLVGLTSPTGVHNDGLPGSARSLTGDNDTGMSFENIAKVIESEPAGLFVKDEDHDRTAA
jgi:hypothetical protein